ncbi:MAG: aminopeptidase P family protein [Atopobiaceae bacterium]|nr:aminopeptidase P family protein [Atopobiaceae bacterium]
MQNARIARTMENLANLGISQALICDPLSVWYLTGYYVEPMERFFALHLTQRGSRARATLFCNELFPSAEGAAHEVITFSDTQNPIALVAQACDPTLPLGIDKSLQARWLIPLMEAGACASVRLASSAIDDARSIKDPDEQTLMRIASHLNDRGMEWLTAQVHVGQTERGIAERLPSAYRELGAEGNSFDPIISFGANAADPHHEPDSTPFAKGNMVLFDVGCKYDWYCADMTRTFFTEEPTELQLKVYDTVRRANEAAETIIRPGVRFSEIDRTARKVIEDEGYGPNFNHRLGHQIGLSVHEPGDVSAANLDEVRPGQIFSIEPGIYIPNTIGVRIEDLVLVTQNGCEVLNHYTHEPVVLDV